MCPDSLKEYFSKTKGWPVFQEDIMQIAEDRNIKNSKQCLRSFSKNLDLNNYKEYFTEKEFDFLLKYTKYTFNKSHALSYSYYTLLDVYMNIICK